LPPPRGLLKAQAMTLLGAPVPLVALASMNDVLEDGRTDGMRTLLGALGVLVIIAIVIGIGQMMTGSERSAR
jgi:hypothetical protein